MPDASLWLVQGSFWTEARGEALSGLFSFDCPVAAAGWNRTMLDRIGSPNTAVVPRTAPSMSVVASFTVIPNSRLTCRLSPVG
jgi:hypothetical protein